MYTNCIDAENEFEKCWNNPNYTAIQLDDVDVNHSLSHYTLQKPIHFTKKMLWDMETKKAWNPANYISYVVKAGSAKSWDKHPCPKTGGEIFVRCSAQKKWLEPSIYEMVYEEVYVNEKAKLITFIGVTALPEKKEIIHPSQPLFHVQHGASGTEDRPLNTWRIVHLTRDVDQQLINHFKNFNNPTTLPGFIEAYIKNDLKINIEKK
jgi:hypothetical protein